MVWLDLQEGVLEEFAERAARPSVFDDGYCRYMLDGESREAILARNHSPEYRSKDAKRKALLRSDPAYRANELAQQRAVLLDPVRAEARRARCREWQRAAREAKRNGQVSAS